MKGYLQIAIIYELLNLVLVTKFSLKFGQKLYKNYLKQLQTKLTAH